MTRKTALQLIVGALAYTSLKAQEDKRKYQKYFVDTEAAMKMPPEKRDEAERLLSTATASFREDTAFKQPEEYTVMFTNLKRLNVVIGAKTFTFTLAELAKALET